MGASDICDPRATVVYHCVTGSLEGLGWHMRVGLYLRISDDRDGTQTATERQRADCLRFAETRGWTVADVFEDVDLSAYKRRVKCPEFERMLAAVRGGQVDGVLAWKIDRLTRRMRDFVRLDEACEDGGGFVATVADGIDTREPQGRFVAELLVAQARMESQNQSTRIRRKEAERAANGLPSTGGDRLFGYTRNRESIQAEEAELVREAAERVLSGEAIGGICWDWRRRGVVGVQGKPLSRNSLRRLLMRPAIAGLRSHDGQLVAGTWPPIITPEKHQRLVAILGDPSRLTRHSSRRYLLTGMVVCDTCGNLMVGRPRDDKRPRYVCNRQPETNACGTITRLCEPVDRMVSEAIFRRLDGVDLGAFISEDRDADAGVLAAIAADEEALAELDRDYYVKRKIGRGAFFSLRDELQGRVRANRATLARSSRRSILSTLDGAQVRQEWAERGIDWQRALVAALIAEVRLLPAVRGYNRFDPSKVVITWRD